MLLRNLSMWQLFVMILICLKRCSGMQSDSPQDEKCETAGNNYITSAIQLHKAGKTCGSRPWLRYFAMQKTWKILHVDEGFKDTDAERWEHLEEEKKRLDLEARGLIKGFHNGCYVAHGHVRFQLQLFQGKIGKLLGLGDALVSKDCGDGFTLSSISERGWQQRICTVKASHSFKQI